MKTQWVFTAVTITSVMLAGCNINLGGSRAKAEKEAVLSAPLASGGILTADTNFGSIKIRGDNVQTCEVQAHIQVQAPTQEQADALLANVSVVLEHKDDGLSLRVDKPHLGRNESVGVSYDIVVPTKTRLDCTTSFGAIHVQQTQGDVKARTSFGPIHCESVTGDLDLKTSHGKIDMDQVQALKIHADTSFGSVELACQETDVTQGRITLKTSHGSIHATNMRVPVLEAQTSFGSVSVTYAPDGPEDLDATLSSSHGSLTMIPPETFKGSVELSTSHGSIQVDRPVTVQGKLSKDRITGTLGDGPGRISMNTSFASVKLR